MVLPKSSKAVFATTLAAVTLIWLVGLLIPSHGSLEPLRWSPFPPAGEAWTVTGWPEAATFNEGVTLRSSASGVNRLSFAVPLERPVAERAWLQVSGRIVEQARQGESWATAVVGLGFVTASGETFGYRNLRFVPRRATAPERFSSVVEWPTGAVEARLSLHSRPGAPTFTLLEGSAEFVEPNPLYTVALAALAAGALCWLVVLFRFARAHEATALLVAPGIVAIAIVVGVSLSSQALRPVLMPLLIVLEGGFGVDRTAASIALLKGGHAFAFFLLTLGLLSLRRRIRVRRTHLVLFAALLAIGSEGLQAHISGRSGTLQDVLVDLAGVLVALVAFQLVTGRSRRRKKKVRRQAAEAGGVSESAVAEPGAAGVAVPRATDVDALDATGVEVPGPTRAVALEATRADALGVTRADVPEATRADALGVTRADTLGTARAAALDTTQVEALDATCVVSFAPDVDEGPKDEPAPIPILKTMALWTPDIDLGSPWHAPLPAGAGEAADTERRKKSRRRSRGVRRRLTRAFS